MSKLVSIIVLCYNNLEEATKPCIESLIANTEYDSYELIVVDNASTDGTVEYLKEIQARIGDGIKLHFNSTNKGYAAGNNDGIKLAKGDYIVLLNNDTLVSDGWLKKLVMLFYSQDSIGLIGPVTNSAGNEQRIDFEGLDENNYEDISSSYLSKQKDSWFLTEKLGFFCVAIRREVIEGIGYLDENFGVGMFEDDDFCERVKNHGYKLAIVEDCFIYHKGSISFKKLDSNNYQDLFEKNKKYFREKHGVEWTFTDIALSYWMKLNSDMLGLSQQFDIIPTQLESMRSRMRGFKYLLMQIQSVELQSLMSHERKRLTHPVALEANKSSRWSNFRNNLIYGSVQQKCHYIKTMVLKILALVLKSEIIHQKAYRTDTFYDHIIKEFECIKSLQNGKKIVIFPATIDFNYMNQRPQSLARAFSDAGFFVIYGTLNHQVDKVTITQKINDSLFLIHQNYFDFISHVFDEKDCIYYCLWPNNIKFLDTLPYSFVIYDYMDDLSLLELPEQELNENHLNIMKRADLITVSADNLLSKIPPHLVDKTILINNAVSSTFIDSVKESENSLIKTDVKVLGYFGAIAEWMDFQLIEKLALKFESARIVLIGPVSENVRQTLSGILWKHKNVVLMPNCDHDQLSSSLVLFDVCLIPFLKNEITDSVSPVKLFEYLSAGKPVVSTNIHECRKYDVVNVADTHEEFIKFIEDSLNGQNDNLVHIYKSIAWQNTWAERVDRIVSNLT
jgi:GT2 family glycosyltransferase/glycosyltransferase involved in cell wall biosynthesis